MSLPEFGIEITGQGWITDDEESARWDRCTHGDLRLVVGGTVIVPGDGDGEFTISTSALQLLRTLESDHVPRADGSERLILHCGMLLMASCPIGVDWRVTHRDGMVCLEDVVRVDDRATTRFPGLVVEVAQEEYRRQIVAFAEKAKEPFVGVEKSFEDDDYDLVLYPRFWAEYDAIIARHRG